MFVCRSIFIAVLLTYLLVSVSFGNPVLHVQLEEHKISQQNDTVYVHEIMRLAKAAEMTNYMQPELSACDNFYQYACGNWPKINPAVDIQPRQTNIFQLLTNAYQHKQLKLLQENVQEDDTPAVIKVKTFYESCLHHHNTPHARHVRKLQEIVAEFGHMPVLSLKGQEWPSQEFNWVKTIGEIQKKYGLDVLLGVSVEPDFRNRSVNKFYLGQPVLHLDAKTMYTNEATTLYRDEYRTAIQRQLVAYLDVDETLAALTAAEILKFEVAIAKGSVDKKLGRALGALTKLRTIDEIQNVYAPAINFTQYFEALGHSPNDTFYELVPEYQANLAEVVTHTPKSTVANYVYYKLLETFFYDSEDSAVEQCLSKTKNLFPKLIDKLVYQKYNLEATTTDVRALWRRLQQTVKLGLEGTTFDWMLPMTRKVALEKLETMSVVVDAHTEHDFDADYGELQVGKTKYLENLKLVLALNVEQKFAQLSVWPKGASDNMKVNMPYFGAAENIIKIPVPLLQPNFLWSAAYPNALWHGTLGYLIARELLHGFDNDASHWWDSNATALFNVRKNCFKKQYSRFRLEGRYLTESELQMENMIDNGAVQIAYKTYLNWLADNVEHVTLDSESLPSINLSNRQLFFVSFAQFWCSDVSAQLRDKIALIDITTPNIFRVNGPLANFHEFSKTFGCVPGAPMNPQQRCQLYSI